MTDNPSEAGAEIEALSPFRAMPDPTEQDLADPMFEAIWQVIKTWDVSVPECYVGYTGAMGNHVMLILEKVRAAQAERLKLAEAVCKWAEFISKNGLLPHDMGALTKALAAWRSARGET
jgi:hypothetical protein